MANIDIRRQSTQPPARSSDMFANMRDEMDRMFERFENGWPRLPSLFNASLGDGGVVPELDVRDDGKHLTIEAELPGVDDKDVTVTLANGVLTIKGEKKSDRQEKREGYYIAERSFGSFARSLRLPETIDDNAIEARFDKGVLKVIAQKRPEAVKAEKKIEIKKA